MFQLDQVGLVLRNNLVVLWVLMAVQILEVLHLNVILISFIDRFVFVDVATWTYLLVLLRDTSLRR